MVSFGDGNDAPGPALGKGTGSDEEELTEKSHSLEALPLVVQIDVEAPGESGKKSM